MHILHIGSHDCNGTDLPVPSTIQVDLQDIDASSTGRNLNGTMIRKRKCGGAKAKRKVSCTWKGLTLAQSSALLQAIDDVYFTIAYNDPYTGGWRTDVKVYAGDRSLPTYIIRKPNNTSDPQLIWETCSVNFVEV